MTDVETSVPSELLTFRLGDQEYSLDIMCVREIRGWTRTTPLPHAPKHMKGVINLRGTVLPVMDLAERLGMESREHTERNVIIVVKHKDSMTGLLVDAVSDIIALTESDLQPPPEMSTSSQAGVIKALTLLDERMIRVLDLSNIIELEKSEAA
ncbi:MULTISPECIES: chemotaxis protein CheW [Ascidiaceihabitans]|uniref:Chemotaxis protein CheW n=1 Tax=Ascidiaceihabitans donghaensis TaxID=1510460 RepID=A0A2R8BEY0_9RHOB|nr:chemotaxis protein CheW [Ascidiaceihabitans donghaensis]SPH21556.1 Chemotaxis protein CheW [Ascidiaceihabitans donghaensis]